MLSPLPSAKFDAYAAAHLMWRAGFGCTWSEARKISRDGLDAAVNALLAPRPAPDRPPCAAPPEESDRAFRERIERLENEEERGRLSNERRKTEREHIEDLQFWWLQRMVATGLPPEQHGPLIEKLALFWHGHFASSFEDKIERVFPLWQQNQTWRRLALAPFPKLLDACIRDPAMLVWLDNAESHAGHPNENLARELMELFSTGVGPYEEKDVQESARALTGYGVDRDDWSFHFRENQHDSDGKTFFGQTGKWDGGDIVRIICEQPATGRFVMRKLLEFFVMSQVQPETVETLGDEFRESGYDLTRFLGTLFRSEYFYSAAARVSVVKSPAVLAVGALKCMHAGLPAPEVLLSALRLMGQSLFFPPDVNGWPGGASWISSNTLLIRYNFANFLLHGVSPDEFKMFDREAAGSGAARREFIEKQRTDLAVAWHPKKQLKETGQLSRMATGGTLVDYYATRFLQRPLPPALERELLKFAETDAAGGRRSFSVNDANFDERVCDLVHLIMSSPEYQLC